MTASEIRSGSRIESVDILRGAVVMLMVFVNSVSGMKGVPGWTQHLPAETDGYTVTDMVLPWFLFLVGVSLPLSLGRFVVPDGPTAWLPALRRILPRVIGLLVLGLAFVNVGRHSEAATGMSRQAWMVLTLIAAIMVWGSLPGPSSRWWEKARIGLRLGGVAGLVFLLVTWRGTGPDDVVIGIRPKWWGILGIIAWAYLVGALVFLLTKGKPAALIGVVGLMVCVYIASRAGRLPFPGFIGRYWGAGHYLGSVSAIVVAGSVAGLLALSKKRGGWWILVLYGCGLWIAGWLLRPLHGYHKLGSTESWALVAAGQGTLMLAACRALFDARGDFFPAAIGRPFAFIGRNALLAYILPSLLGPAAHLVGLDLMPMWGRGGAAGMANAALYAGAVGALTAGATRAGVILRL